MIFSRRVILSFLEDIKVEPVPNRQKDGQRSQLYFQKMLLYISPCSQKDEGRSKKVLHLANLLTKWRASY